ncbi:DnaJ domain-containing protein [Besnoitia besnoiti]|uniref:DnaJ domain-containing protein n=1 Tax=Besnoitia besnoiti TaxID=94643 RepID=A0A2A9MM10_BESBE|nr:DnaJ domain-containing protein [Besnoitia besnoiti]PFH37106.1 DnaJ domain-containing protein [Besnoitia besnoiti]
MRGDVSGCFRFFQQLRSQPVFAWVGAAASGSLASFRSACAAAGSTRARCAHTQSHPPSWSRDSAPPDPFLLLGLKTEAPTAREVRLAYLNLAKKLHPDRASAAASSHPPASRDLPAVRKNRVTTFFSISPLGKLTFEDVQWAYETALACLEAAKEDRHSAAGVWSVHGRPFRPQTGRWHPHSHTGKSAGKQERERTARLRDWKAQQRETAAFWRHRHALASASQADRRSEESEIFRRLLRQRLRDEEASQLSQRDRLSRVAADDRTRFGAKHGVPDASRDTPWSDDDFARLQREELEELGISTATAEKLNLLGPQLPRSAYASSDANCHRTTFRSQKTKTAILLCGAVGGAAVAVQLLLLPTFSDTQK